MKIEHALHSESHNWEELVGAVKTELAGSMAALTVSSAMPLWQVLVHYTTSYRLAQMVHPMYSVYVIHTYIATYMHVWFTVEHVANSQCLISYVHWKSSVYYSICINYLVRKYATRWFATTLYSVTDGHCGLCALYSEVDLPSWVKAVAKGPSLDTNEEVHTVVRVHTAHVYCTWVCANGASCGNCCCAICMYVYSIITK